MNRGKPGIVSRPVIIIPMIHDYPAHPAPPGNHRAWITVYGDNFRRQGQNSGLSPNDTGFRIERRP